MPEFSDLVITKKDYYPSPDNPDYYILPQSLLLSLHDAFERSVKAVFPAEAWELAEGEIPWDSGVTGVKVTPVSHTGEPSRRTFVLDYSVQASLSKAMYNKDTGTENATVYVRILIYVEGKYYGMVCDHEQSGPGWYDPARWSQDAYDMMDGYYNHGQTYIGY